MIARKTLDDLVILGIKGTVLALDASTGAEVWRAPLKGSDFTNLTIENGRILAGTRGEVFCLDALTGRMLWNNGLRGMGYGMITFASSAQAPAIAQQAMDAQSAHDATTMSNNTTMHST